MPGSKNSPQEITKHITLEMGQGSTCLFMATIIAMCLRPLWSPDRSSEQLPLSSSCTACLAHCSVSISCFCYSSCCSGHRDFPCPGLLGAHLPASFYTWPSPSPVQGTHIKDLLLVPFPLLLASSFTPSLVSPSLSPHHQAKSITPCNVQLGAPANTWQEGAQEHVLK